MGRLIYRPLGHMSGSTCHDIKAYGPYRRGQHVIYTMIDPLKTKIHEDPDHDMRSLGAELTGLNFGFSHTA